MFVLDFIRYWSSPLLIGLYFFDMKKVLNKSISLPCEEQITEILQDVANEKDGFNKIMKLSLEVLMKSERKLHQEESGDYANGYRPRFINGCDPKIIV